MRASMISLGFVSLAFSGCAAYEIQALSVNHPANAYAVAAPERPVSKILAYSRQDMPAISVAAAQKTNEARHAGDEAKEPKTVVGEGKVIATVASANQLVVEHGEIKGFMEPMTMGYRIEPSSLLEGLKAGDQVRFTIDVPKKTIVKIEKLK